MFASESLRIMLYSNLSIMGWIVALFFYFSQYKRKKEVPSYFFELLKKRISKKPNKTIDVIWFILENVVIYLFAFLPATILNSSFGDLLKTGPNYFGYVYFLPIIFTFFCCIIWVNPVKQLDLYALCLPLSLFFTRLGCFAYGCCFGIEWEHGLYNYPNERFEVPMQLMEGLIALGLFFLLLYLRKKAKPGTIFPMYLILYSFLRFFNEFFSGAPRFILIFFNKYQVLCIIGVVVGLIQYILVLKYGDKISTYFEENPYGFIKALIAKIKKPKNQKVKTK